MYRPVLGPGFWARHLYNVAMKRPPPSPENPVVLEGILPSGQGPHHDFNTFFRNFQAMQERTCAVGLDANLNELIAANQEGKDFQAYEGLEDIPWVQREPGLLFFNCDRISDGEIAAFRKERNWKIGSVAAIGSAPSRHKPAPASKSVDPFWIWFTVFCATALLIILMIYFRGLLFT